ncbi:MAG: ABC transporter substrate-binding protein [Symbiobacteriaceae bacterium]|nr:ABC transporter substrate-binding protein [Symbiobacteriaceae bacterium]
MTRKLLVSLLVPLLVLSMVACNTTPPVTPPQPTSAPPTTAPPPPAQDVKILRLADTQDIRNVNPHNGNWISEDNARGYLSARLYRATINPTTKKQLYLPEAAAELPIQMDDEGIVWRIPLDPKMAWENGELFTADTWMYTFERACDPVMVNPMGSWVFSNDIIILNGEEYYLSGEEGTDYTWEDVGIKKIDDYTLEFTLAGRYTQEEVIRHFTGVSPVYEPFYEAGMNASRTSTTYATSIDSFMASGPYSLEFWEVDSERVYTKNYLWPLADLIKIEKISFSIVPDTGAMMQLFESGELDIMDLDAVTFVKYEQDPRLHTYPSAQVGYFNINMANPNNPLLSNVNFRRAISWAIDREAMAKIQLSSPWASIIPGTAGGYGGVSYKDLPEVKAVYPENHGYNPDKAREYYDLALEELGLTTADFEIILNEQAVDRRNMVEYLQNSLTQIFGEDKINITLKGLPAANASTLVLWTEGPTTYESGVSSWSWGSTLYYPNLQFQFFTPSGQLNVTDYNCPELDAMYVLSRTDEYRMDPKKLVELTMEMEALLRDQVLVIPITNFVGRMIISERLLLPIPYDAELGYGTMWADIDLTK